MDGRPIRVWGFVDTANLFGDETAHEILGEWWSGTAQDTGTWRFNMKVRTTDDAGESFPVLVRVDAGRDALLRAFVEDARAGRPTRVYVTGTVHTFDAPSNMVTRTGLYLTVQNSGDIGVDEHADGRPLHR